MRRSAVRSAQYAVVAKEKAGASLHRLFLWLTSLLSLLRLRHAHLLRGPARVSQNLVVVRVTVRRVAAPDAPVVAQQSLAHVRRILDRLLEDLHTVTDVGLDVEQVGRAAAPAAGVKRHHLHQTTGAD